MCRVRGRASEVIALLRQKAVLFNQWKRHRNFVKAIVIRDDLTSRKSLFAVLLRVASLKHLHIVIFQIVAEEVF